MMNWNAEKILSRIRPALLIVGLSSIIYLLYQSWDISVDSFLSMDVTLMTFSMIVAVLYIYSVAALFSDVARGYGAPLPVIAAFKILSISQITKYIPGKVWVFIYQKSAIGKILTFRTVLLVNFRIMLLTLLGMTIVGLIYISFLKQAFLAMFAIVFLLPTVSITVSRGVLFSKDGALSRLYYKILGDVSYTSKITVLKSIVYALLISFLSTFVVCLIYSSLYNLPIMPSLNLAVTQQLAWIGSAFFFFVPAGLGVRELLFVFLGKQAQLQDTQTLISMAVTCRIVIVFQDLFIAGLGAFVSKWSNSKS